MFQSSNIPFIPVQGTEMAILAKTPQEGHIYFATDTKKIYYPDVLNNSYLYEQLMYHQNQQVQGQPVLTEERQSYTY